MGFSRFVRGCVGYEVFFFSRIRGYFINLFFFVSVKSKLKSSFSFGAFGCGCCNWKIKYRFSEFLEVFGTCCRD